jgi:hypothetical protein
MDLREGEQTTSIQRLGRAAEALQFALCQSLPSSPGEAPIIRLFPAWPENWDARFSLMCRGGFRVHSKFQQGTIEFVEIISAKGSECQLRNPWQGKSIIGFRNGKRWKTFRGDRLTFPTKSGDVILIVPEGVDVKALNKKFFEN